MHCHVHVSVQLHFPLAIRPCSAAQRNSVYLAEAASLFEEGDYVAAAALYGKVWRAHLSAWVLSCGVRPLLPSNNSARCSKEQWAA